MPPFAPRQEWPHHRGDFPLVASPTGRFLTFSDGDRPFYYSGDTHWPLIWHYNLEEALEIAADRRRVGFTVMQISLLPFGDVPNVAGHKMFENRATLTPNEDYFAHADRVLDGLESMGFAVYLVVLWWNQIDRELRQLTPEVCREFGHWLGRRWRARLNLLFVLGGDQQWREADRLHFRGLAEGIRSTNATQLISLHPRSDHSSSEYVMNEDWLGFNSIQVHHASANIAGYALADLGRKSRHGASVPLIVVETNYFWRDHCARVYKITFCIHETAAVVRASHWAARLGGGSCGEGFGAWPFWTGLAGAEEWRPALSSQPCAYHIGNVMQGILSKYNWHALQPDAQAQVVRRDLATFVGSEFIPAALTAPASEPCSMIAGCEALIYFAARPREPTTDQNVTLDLAWFGMGAGGAGAIAWTWYDAKSGAERAVGRSLDLGSQNTSWHTFDPELLRSSPTYDRTMDLVLAVRAIADWPPSSPPKPTPSWPPLQPPVPQLPLQPPVPQLPLQSPAPQLPLPPRQPQPRAPPHTHHQHGGIAAISMALAVVGVGGLFVCGWLGLMQWRRATPRARRHNRHKRLRDSDNAVAATAEETEDGASHVAADDAGGDDVEMVMEGHM